MNKFTNNLLKTFAAAAVILPFFSSCEDNIVYEKMEECNIGVRLRFVYDYHMEYANAFPSQVDCINVFFYDENGRCVETREVIGSVLADENYRMEVDLAPGHTYDIVAYGGTTEGHTSFLFNNFPTVGSKINDRFLTLKDSEVGEELHPLFFGVADVTTDPLDLDYKEQTVYLMKDTNAIRVLLQQVDGEPMEYQMFDFKIFADNTQMQQDNKVVLTGQNTTYLPWVMRNENPGSLPDGSKSLVCWAEFSIPRLIWDTNQLANFTRADNIFNEYEGPILQILYKADQREVVNIPLLRYLLMCKPVRSNAVNSRELGDQEFLDRENRYDLFFFLDRHYQWLYLEIQVRDWVVRVNNAEF